MSISPRPSIIPTCANITSIILITEQTQSHRYIVTTPTMYLARFTMSSTTRQHGFNSFQWTSGKPHHGFPYAPSFAGSLQPGRLRRNKNADVTARNARQTGIRCRAGDRYNAGQQAQSNADTRCKFHLASRSSHFLRSQRLTLFRPTLWGGVWLGVIM